MKFTTILYVALAAVPAFSAPMASSSAPVPTATMTMPHTTMPNGTMPNGTMTNGTMVNTTAIASELNAAVSQLVNAINALEGTNGTTKDTVKMARRSVVAALSDSLDGSNDHHLRLRSDIWSTFANELRSLRH